MYQAMVLDMTMIVYTVYVSGYGSGYDNDCIHTSSLTERLVEL